MPTSPEDAPPAAKRKTSFWVFALKYLLGIGLLAALLIWKDNGSKMIGHFRGMRIEQVGLLVLIAIILNWISCLKWQLFLAARQVRVSIGRLLGLYMVGRFFSNFLPSMIGGDLTRIYLLGRHIDSHAQSFASVLLERVTGMVALITLALVFTACNPDMLRQPEIAVAVGGAAAALAVLLALLFIPGLLGRLNRIAAGLPLIGKVVGKLGRVYEELAFFRNQHGVMAKAMAYSFAFHLFTSVNVYATATAIGCNVSFLDCAVLTPIILLLNSVPVSPNNIGWWEWSFSVLLRGAGAEASEGLAVALTLRAVSFVLSISGGILYLAERKPAKKT